MHDVNSFEKNFMDKVASRPGGERVRSCFLCGTCTAGCPISNLNAKYNPRRIMRMISLGMRDEILASPEIWQCIQCHVCVAHCPQDVRFADIMRVLWDIAVEEGYVAKELIEKIDKLDVEIKQKRMKQIEQLLESNS
ncbi:MAG: 4Fe-4S dicluster domain-containing protein [Clostridia bacterium]